MDFHFACTCGKQIKVTAVQAGTEVRCECGRANSVPSLSELRRLAGKDAFITNAAEMIDKLLSEGTLPKANCVNCGGNTESLYQCDVICEEVWLKRSRENRTKWVLPGISLISLFLGRILFIWRSPPEGNIESDMHGRETIVQAPFRLCQSCRNVYSDFKRQDVLKRVLSGVKEYAQLLNEYEDAKVVIVQEPKTDS